MNVTDNAFQLIDIKVELNHALLIIALKADDETSGVYLNTYYEGLYIGTISSKYSVYAEVKDEYIVGELLYDTIRECASKQSEKTKRLWVRCRVGNTYIDHAVDICIEEIEIAFSHMEDFIFSKNSNLELSINYCDKTTLMKNPPWIFRDIRDIKIAVTENGVAISATVRGGLAGELCLAWKESKTNEIYYFHPEYILDNSIGYILSKDEMNKFFNIKANSLSFEWIMVDVEGNQYKLYLDNEIDSVDRFLPVDDYCAQLYKGKENDLCMYMNTSLLFNYSGIAYDGNGIRLEFSKRSYNLILLSVVMRRVNTDIEYQLPFEVVSEDESKVTYDIRLNFGAGEDEDGFSLGIYQFFVELSDGFINELYPLRLFRSKPIPENTYLIFTHPYSVIGGHYYNCLFYNDPSNNLKCNIVQKRMRLQLSGVIAEEEKICISYRLKKEPYFDTVSEIRLVAENGDSKTINYAGELSIDGQYEITGCMSISLEWMYKLGINCIFRPEICFNDRKDGLLIENNYFRPAVTNRELCSFSVLNKLSDSIYRRLWGEHINGSYILGVTEDAGLFTLVGMWLYENDKLCIRIEWSDDNAKEKYHDKDITLYLRDVITGKQIGFDRELAVENEIIFRVPLSEVNIKEFLVVGVMPNGVVSYIENTLATYTLFSNATSKKVSLLKVCGSLHICVEEMLLYENAEKVAECQKIIVRAREEKERKSRRIWLIGENYGLSARDNGLAFFEYCLKHKDNIAAEVFFVTKEENEDMGVLKQYKEHLLIYDSREHIYFDEMTEIYLVAHGIRDVMPSLYHNSIKVFRKNIIYLQHGVIAMKRIGINNKSYGGSILKILVSSQQEKNFLIEGKQFWEEQVAVTGLARFDKLCNNVSQTNKYIWIMPTWRDWLVASEREFVNSDFYAQYSEILGSPMLIEELKKNGQQLLFTLHVEFEKYKSYFEKFENEVVHISDMHEKSITERISECSMIVTDYSSIVFDVIYLGKPVLFFQYDQDIYSKYRGSYINLDTDLPGEVTHSLDTFIEALIREIENGFIVEDKYCARAKKYFDHLDKQNCERIYNLILECREEIADEY
ncbi:MAG: CDP-glycerol glycerophosphotransferase family protein [Lachnospiraceae bacterium]|nr:CDP-glycerol glycerophosphotransferase family protein [Lachnospiraceae bacterium]